MAPTEDCPVAREVTVRPETDSPLATALLDEIRSLDAGRPGPSVLDLAIESYGKETRTLCEQLGEVVRLGDVRQVAVGRGIEEQGIEVRRRRVLFAVRDLGIGSRRGLLGAAAECSHREQPDHDQRAEQRAQQPGSGLCGITTLGRTDSRLLHS